MIQVGQGFRAHSPERALAGSARPVAPERRADPALVTPLAHRILPLLPFGEATAGMAIAAVLLLVPLVRETILGRLVDTLTGAHDLHVVIVESLLVGYLVFARAFTVRAARATIEEEIAAGRMPEAAGESLHDEIGRYRRLRFVLAGTAGGLLAALAPVVVLDATAMPWNGATSSPENAWRHVLAIAVGWLIATYLFVVIRESRRISAAADLLQDVNLFDSGSFVPFGRFGVSSAFTTAGLFSVFSLILVEHGFAVVVATVGSLSAVAAAAGLLFPLRGLRERICEEKERELACCRVALRSARDALVEGRMVTTDHGHMSEVVAYTRFVESVNEWPLDTPTVVRVGASVLLPMASWLSGAIGSDVASRVVAMLFG
jgi:hypothetical protein